MITIIVMIISMIAITTLHWFIVIEQLFVWAESKEDILTRSSNVEYLASSQT